MGIKVPDIYKGNGATLPERGTKINESIGGV